MTVAEIERAGGTAAAATVDVTDLRGLAGAVAELSERLGAVDALINNAGIWGPVGPMWEVDETDWWRTFEINVAARIPSGPRA